MGNMIEVLIRFFQKSGKPVESYIASNVWMRQWSTWKMIKQKCWYSILRVVAGLRQY